MKISMNYDRTADGNYIFIPLNLTIVNYFDSKLFTVTFQTIKSLKTKLAPNGLSTQ